MRKQRKLHQTISQRHLRAREPFSIGRIWAGIPNRWRGLFFGALLGAGLLLVVPALVQIDLVTGCVVLAVPFLMVLGFAIGKGIDSRKELEDLIH
jgi:VIT1/CCC1 family predicted Fe2+/Mn2+ transporter